MDKAGKSAQEILDAFVAEVRREGPDGAQAEGFNLWGYLLPGLADPGRARCRPLRVREPAASGGGRRGGRGAGCAGRRAGASATPEELERLRQALAEVED